MRLSDTILGALLLVFAAILLLYAATFPAIPGQEYGAAVFPVLIAIGFFGCGLILVARGLRVGDPLVIWSAWVRNPQAICNVGIVVLMVVFYVVAADTIGFLLSMTIVLFITFRMLRLRWASSALLALVVSAVMQWGFGTFLYVPLPRGVLVPDWL